MVHWLLHNAFWLGLAAAGLFILGLAAAGTTVVLMPADHFLGRRREGILSRCHPAIRLPLRIGKNLAGIVIAVTGLVMAVPGVPGPGLLLMVLGLSLLDIPGKMAVERYIVSRPMVLRPVNALRARFKRPPLQLPPQ